MARFVALTAPCGVTSVSNSLYSTGRPMMPPDALIWSTASLNALSLPLTAFGPLKMLISAIRKGSPLGLAAPELPAAVLDAPELPPDPFELLQPATSSAAAVAAVIAAMTLVRMNSPDVANLIFGLCIQTSNECDRQWFENH